MDLSKIITLVEGCREILSQLDVDKKLYPFDRTLDSIEHEYSHCYALLDHVERVADDGNITLALQLLGFVQGCMWSHKLIHFEDVVACKCVSLLPSRDHQQVKEVSL